VNTPRSFQALVAEHEIGGRVDGEVVQFTSHGAMVSVRVGRRMHVVCYAPLAGLGSPPPTRARDALKKGEVYRFQIVAFDATRRRAELALA
jgi:ribosomal protein S1